MRESNTVSVPPAISHLSLFCLQALLVAGVLLVAYWLRRHFGLALLCIALGVLQPIQVIVSAAIYVEILPGLPMSPGSVVLFAGSLFAVLLVYIREDALATRKLIYGLVAANVAVGAISAAIGLHLQLPGNDNPLRLPAELFGINLRVMLVGTAVLLIDVLLIIAVYDWVGRRLTRSPFLRIYTAMALVMIADSALFTAGAFAGRTEIGPILLAGLVGKLSMSLLYAGALATYLRHVEPSNGSEFAGGQLREVIHALTYRDKYELTRARAARQLRQAERHAAVILQATTDGLLAVTVEGEVIEINRAAEDMFGCRREAVLGTSVYGLLSPASRPALCAALTEAAQGISSNDPVAAEGRPADGPVLHLEITVAPTSIGDDPAFIVSMRDCTEQRRSRAEKLQAEKMEVVGRLAGGVAHDFNNLLTALIGHADRIDAETPTNAPVRSDVDGLRLNIDRATELTRQLLSFARRRESADRTVDLHDVVREHRVLLERLLGAAIDIRFQHCDTPLTVEVDPVMLGQVLVNLAVNARDAMPNGGSLTVGTARGAGDTAELTVRDTGRGMPESVQRQIFEPFFSTKGERGNGLGLAICYRVVQQAGGTIAVDSGPDRGTTVTVRLPLSEKPIDAPADEQPGLMPGGVETVLVVDDDAAVLDIVSATLTSAGYRVLATDRPSEALRIAAEHDGPIDLLVTDRVMPDMTGSALAARLRRSRPALPVLMISGYPAEDAAEHTLQKPFAPRQLAIAVRRALTAPHGAPP